MPPILLNTQEYRDKVLACWLGKNIGGTLGAPMEWRRQVNNVSFYTQNLGGEPLPNDDLDIQLLWLVALEERGIELDSHTLAEYWCLYVTPHWAEYGNAKINLRTGLLPPLSGSFNNEYKDSCGAFIRSEIWACIAPGRPDLAAKYAYEDAILDHGDGEGMYAEIFCAALESAAFLVSNIRQLIEIGLSYIPRDCGIAGAVRCAIQAHASGKDWKKAREAVLRDFRGSTFFGDPERTSPADRRKGFHEGKRGYDAPSNIGLLVVGLLYGGGDFDKTLCTAVNCGEDTDCTGATAGSIFGLMHGTRAIPQKWIEPIGRGIKTACLNLGELGYFGDQLPQNVDDLTARTERVARQVLLRQSDNRVQLSDDAQTDLTVVTAAGLRAPDQGAGLYTSLNGPRFKFDFFTVELDYGDAPVIRNNVAKQVRVTIRNTYKTQANLSLRWQLPDGWRVHPSSEGWLMSLPMGVSASGLVSVDFTIRAEQVNGSMNRGVLEITCEGRPTVMLVPITLMNGNLLSTEEGE